MSEKWSINFDEISPCLNGIGRIIEYSTTHQDRTKCLNPTIDPKTNLIISLTEGCFVNGHLEGFGRQIDALGDCKVGFWATQDNEETKPYGKFSHYHKDGSFKKSGGAYLGQVMLKTLDIQDFQENFDITAYRQNIIAAISPG